jgi:rod shape-determining protein MreD
MSYTDGERILLNNQRERQASKFRAWVMVLIPLIAILCQVYLPLFFSFMGFLELPLMVVIYFALMKRSQLAGMAVGALIGLAQDSLSKNPLGMFGIVKTLVGYFASSIGVRLDVDNAVMRFFLTWFFFVFHQFFYWVLGRALLAQNLAFEIRRPLALGALNALIAVVLFRFLDRLRETR